MNDKLTYNSGELLLKIEEQNTICGNPEKIFYITKKNNTIQFNYSEMKKLNDWFSVVNQLMNGVF